MAIPDLTGFTSGQLVRFVQRNLRLYAFNGRDRMQVLDGASWQYAGIYNGPTSIPKPVPAASGAVNAGALTGRYRYYIQAVNKSHPTIGNYYVAALESALSDEVKVTGQDISVGTIPATHADPQVTHWQIYRSLNSDYTAFYRVGEVTLGTTSFTDAVSDETLLGSNIQLNVDTANIPPTFAWYAVYGDRLFGAGFIPITTGTAAVNNGNATVTFSTAVPNGVIGCQFQNTVDATTYVIIDRPTTTTVLLDRVYAGSTAAAATYTIFRDPSEVWFSEYNNFEAWGPAGEANRNKIVVGGRGQKNRVTGLCALHGELYVFTQDKIYAISGKGVNSADIKITPEPIFSGLGAVGGDSIVAVDNEIFFMSYRGPAVYNVAGQRQRVPELIGEKLGKAWINAFDINYIQYCQAGYNPDTNCIDWALTRLGETENSYVYTYDRDQDDDSWWPKEYVHPRLYLTDYDSSGHPALFRAQGPFIFQEDVGFVDGVPSGTTTGTITSLTTTSLTDSGATFYTTGTGLKERYVHVFTPVAGQNYKTYVGSRRLASNTGTTLTWNSSGSGGGAMTVTVGDTYYVGPVKWYWTTKTWGEAGKLVRPWTIQARFVLQGESSPSTITKTDIVDRTTHTHTEDLTINQNYLKWPVNDRGGEYAYKLEGRQTASQLSIRELTVEPIDQPKDK